MTATTKAPNYTPEQEATILAMLEEQEEGFLTLEHAEVLAEKFGKTVKSLTAKLARMQIYKKKEYTTKTGDKVVKKDAHADAIGAILKLSENEIDSLTKANKTALVKIFEALANSKPL